MKLTLDDETARMSVDLMVKLKEAVAKEIRSYFGTEQINWSAVTTALMTVSADANNVIELDYGEAIYSFTQYMNGRHYGSENDSDTADLMLAAKNGSAEAQFKLGLMHVRGFHVPQDYEEAVNWFRLAAEQGHLNGQYNLGFAYSNGTGVQQNEKEAIKWWSLAAEQGLAQAQHDLGWHYVAGVVVAQNYSTALIWYQLAAAQGFGNSQNNLGEMYLNGQGVAKDYVQAHMWFSLASKEGDPDSLRSVEDIEKEMTPEQIEVARLMAQDWLKLRPKLAHI